MTNGNPNQTTTMQKLITHIINRNVKYKSNVKEKSNLE